MERNVQINTEKRSRYTEREWIRIQEKEKREKQKQRNLIIIAVLLFILAAAMGFMVYYFVTRSHDYTLDHKYNKSDMVLGIGTSVASENVAESFAEHLCVANGEVNAATIAISSFSAGLFDANGEQTVYAKDIFTRRSPASITKVMSALVTLKYGNLDDLVTVTPIVKDIEYGSSVCDIKEGDVLSLRQLLYGMMIASGNDAAMMIAEYVGGSVQGFVDLMNKEAREIGATSTHFTNPHGLTDSEHYTTVYDIYLMMNAAMKYDAFQDIISRKNYYAEYSRVDGSAVAVTWESTNHYFTNEAYPPDNVMICGGKTGTTEDAGACLSLLVKDLYGNPYYSIILHADSKESLYDEMNTVLSLVES